MLWVLWQGLMRTRHSEKVNSHFSINQPVNRSARSKPPLSNTKMTIKPQVTLRTERLNLVPLRSEHREHTMKLDMDPLVMKTVAFGRAFTEDEATQVHTWLMQNAHTLPGFGGWAGFTRQGDLVGWRILASCSERRGMQSLLRPFQRRGRSG